MKGERMIRRVYAEPVSEWWRRMRVFLDTTMDSINGGSMRPRTWDAAAKMRGDDLRDARSLRDAICGWLIRSGTCS